MTRITIAAGCLAAALAAGPAKGFIPPSYKVTVIAGTAEGEAQNRALVEAMQSLQAFFWIAGDVHRNQLEPCLETAQVESCVREKIAAKPVDPRARPVAIIATPDGEHRFRWLCVGSGRKQVALDERQAAVNVQAALFGPERERIANRRAAMNCISAAALESSES